MNDSGGFDGKHAELTEKIIGIFYKVANELGHGFFETVYRRSMLIALRQAGLQAEEEVLIPVNFRGHPVGNFYADIVVESLVVLELKAADEITKSFEAQLFHYLRSSEMEVGIILAFGERAKFRRLYMPNDRKQSLPQPS